MADDAGRPPTSTHEPIAITGIACRFPGADGPRAFWTLLEGGGDAVGAVPRARFDVDALYHPKAGVPGKLATRHGGFLPDVDRFDPYFFGIAPREAASMDPQHRILLELSWEALEDAGIVPASLAGSRTGVFVGLCYNDFEDLEIRDPARIDIYTNIGGARSVLPGRLSFAFDFRGPSLSVDTACSSSLVALHLACRSLRAGESTLALAGGVNLILQPEFSIGFSQAGMLAPDGRCKFGDARADGFVRSEGAGLVVLKPLQRARADGDRIYAVIRGSAVNNDGRSSGALMTPARAGQEEVLRAAYRDAGIAPRRAAYVEAHGTGTRVGDPVELEALGAVLGVDRPAGRPCRVGSVKTNIGHTEGAAGVAGVIKVALALHHGAIPPSLHLQTPNPEVPWDRLPLALQVAPERWPDDGEPAVAGVSAFGISGTNAHVVLEQATAPATHAGASGPGGTVVLPLSAKSPEALRALAAAHERFLREEVEAAALPAVCRTAAAHRTHHAHRLAVVGDTVDALLERLAAFRQDEERRGLSVTHTPRAAAPRVVFVFPGQGSQWLGMGRSLLAGEPPFRDALEAVERAMRPHVDWSLFDALAADEAASRLDEVDVVQPLIFAMQVALAALWRSWGVEPDAVVGHSLGEVAAACVAGALELDDAARIICRRSRLVRATSGRGGMAVVELGPDEAREALGDHEENVAVAAQNGPTTTILSGEREALGRVLAALEREGVFCRWIKVDYASHSPQMDQIMPELVATLEGIRPREASVAFYSTVDASPLPGAALDARYWGRNLRLPVRFWAAVERLAADGHEAFVEISPHPVLTATLEDGLRRLHCAGVVVPSLRREEPERATMLDALGALYANGTHVEWAQLFPAAPRVTLPAYPWQRERFWIEEPSAFARGAGRTIVGPEGEQRPAHPLLAQHVAAGGRTDTHYWQTELSAHAFPYLADHRVGTRIVAPAALYLEMALAAAEELADHDGPVVVEDVRLEQALVLDPGETRTLQLEATPGLGGRIALRFFSRATAERGTARAHATAVLDLHAAAPAATPEVASLAREVSSDAVGANEHYRAMEARDLHYGPSFQGVTAVWPGEGEALARVDPTDVVVAEADRHHLHPALLDACLQAVEACAGSGSTITYLPVSVEALHAHARPQGTLWARARLRPGSEPDADRLTVDLRVSDDAGAPVLELRGLGLRRLDAERTEQVDDWLYEPRWQQAVQAPAPGQDRPRAWLILADAGGLGGALAGRLRARGDDAVVAPAAPGEGDAGASGAERLDVLVRTLAEASASRPTAIVHLGGLDAGDGESTSTILPAVERSSAQVVRLVQALGRAAGTTPPRLWVVTRGAQRLACDASSLSLAQSPLWGLARVLAHEHPELRCARLDLDPAGAEGEVDALLAELDAGEREDEIALRGGERWVQRLTRAGDAAEASAAPSEPPRVATEDRSYRLETSAAGVLDNLRLRERPRHAPRPGQVEVEVAAVGLNFRDVMLAMGLLPPVFDTAIDFGWECAGRVTRIGTGVTGLHPGDAVIAVAPGCFGRHATTVSDLVVRKPAGLSDVEAATIPIVFLTVQHALVELARVRPGERVLIHSASGGVGLAALQVARLLGAEVFATAGTDDKREYLRSLGVDVVMDSRSLGFAEEIMARTHGEGVDVVLNSLSGAAIPRGLATLRAGGRFLELGKTDILQNAPLGLGHFQRNVAFFAIDLAQMFLEDPARCGRLFRDVMREFEMERLRPLPVTTFPVSEAIDAFHLLAQARHVGKVAVDLGDPPATVVAAAPSATTLRPDATYLLTGGTGGLGLVVAGWMVERGARHLVLVSRRGLPATSAPAVRALEEAGAEVVVAPADVARRDELAGVLDHVARSMPPLAGVVHAAGVLDDGVLLQLDPARLATVMAPKVAGAWNLHELTRDQPLDLFVLFSSAAALLGSPGQGNYAAANAFLDALAHERRRQGLPAVSLGWGPWAEVGLAAAQTNRGSRLAERGVRSFAPQAALCALEHALGLDRAQLGIMRFDLRQWCEFYPADAGAPLLAALAAEHAGDRSAGTASDSLRTSLHACEPGARRELLEDHLRKQIAAVLRIAPGRVERDRAFGDLGLDSLMCVELKNRLEASLDATLPSTLIWNYPTIATLTAQLARRLDVPLDATEGADGLADADAAADDAADLAAIVSAASGLSAADLETLAEDAHG